MSVKYYTVALVTLVWISCAPVEQAGQVASSHYTGNSKVDSKRKRAVPLDLRIDIQDTQRQVRVGELHITGGPLISGEEGKVTIKFTAGQALHIYEEEYGGSSGSSNNNNSSNYNSGSYTMYPTINLSFGDADVTCDDCLDRYINYASKSGKYIRLNDMSDDQYFTLKYKITASEDFTLTARLRGKDIDARGTGTVPVELNEKQQATQALQELLGQAGISYDSRGKIKSFYKNGEVRHVPLLEGRKEAGHLLIDHQPLRASQAKRSKARFTFISTGTLGGGNARLSIRMPSQLHVRRRVVRVVDDSHRFTKDRNFLGIFFSNKDISGKLATMAAGEYFYVELELMPLVSLDSPFYFHVNLTGTKFASLGTGRVSGYNSLLQHNIVVKPHSYRQQGLFANDAFLAQIHEAHSSRDGELLVMEVTVWKDMGNHGNDKFSFYCSVDCNISSIYSKELPWLDKQTRIYVSKARRRASNRYELNLQELPAGRTFYVKFSNLKAGPDRKKYYPQVEYLRDGRRVGKVFQATFDWGN